MTVKAALLAKKLQLRCTSCLLYTSGWLPTSPVATTYTWFSTARACTDTRQAYLRVRYCAQARAVENQVYVVATGLVGNQPGVPAMDIHYGQAAVFTPSDFEFPRDGILAEADPNVEMLLVADLDIANLHRARQDGSVTPRLDRRGDLFPFRQRLKR